MKHILVVCGAGMSSSLLTQKMQEYVKTNGIDADVTFIPLMEGSCMQRLGEFDVVLLGPQCGYAVPTFEPFNDKGIDIVVIPMMDYGRMNAKAVVELGLSHIKD